MTSDEAGSWPTDPTALAEIAADPSRPERDQAISDLVPTVIAIARQVVATYPWRVRDRLIDDAVGWIFEPKRIASYRRWGEDGRENKFETWCRTVLHNHAVSVARQKKDALNWVGTVATSANRTDSPLVETIPVPAGRQQIMEDELDLAAPFTKTDLKLVAEQTLETRILVLCVYGIWRKVPTDIWQTWVVEYGLDAKFPPDEFLLLDEMWDRARWLCQRFTITPEAMSQRRSRAWRSWCYKLEFMRQIAPRARDVEGDP